MKSLFTTVDIMVIVAEMQDKVVGMRLVQVYDIDHKTYLLKLQQPELKCVLLMESGVRLHVTEYEWPKNPAPSGFSMKLRKHLRNKRINAIQQLGVDRIVDLTFGSGDATNHVILELYDRGNIVLTDCDYNILNILRPRKDGEDVRFAVNEKYPVDKARLPRPPPPVDELKKALVEAKENTSLKKILNTLLDCGGGVLDHELLCSGFCLGAKLGKDFHAENIDAVGSLHGAVVRAQETVTQFKLPENKQGFIIKKVENRLDQNGVSNEISIYQEFHPFLYRQHCSLPFETFPSFNSACDEFFSKLESVKIDQKSIQQEKEALKKLENVRKDHQRRLQQLATEQENNIHKGQLVELNQKLVESAMLVVRSAIANQIDWSHIEELVAEAQCQGDVVANAIKQLNLQTNSITLLLRDPYENDDNEDYLLDSDEEREEGNESTQSRPVSIDIHLDMSALANARRFYDQKRFAAKKESKTIDASARALQSAEKKTLQALKEMANITSINKARKTHWFEKFLWFISSENYLVIAGRDMQQNELVVKRHLQNRDVYVHAELHGAASVVIKNGTGKDVPPRTLHEAGVMALCYSHAWEERVVTSAWWVWGEQVSKTAPSGEYLTTGSFMIRGKKSFVPPSHLVYGFGFLFRLEESSVERHIGERKIFQVENDLVEQIEENVEESERDVEVTEEFEINEDEIDTECATSQKETDVEFPDTKINLRHIGGDQFMLQTEAATLTLNDKTAEEVEEKSVVFLGDEKPIVLKTKKQNETKVSKSKEKLETNPLKIEEKIELPKRGQKGKQKKIRDKYRHQDDEERKLRMDILQSSGIEKEIKKKKGDKNIPIIKGKKLPSSQGLSPKNLPKGPAKVIPKETIGSELMMVNNMEETEESKIFETGKNEVKEEMIVEEEEETQIADDIKIIDSLTSIPLPEDELLYAVPVCAPYSAMNNYRFKVKLTPGIGKKGKACKTALSLFFNDKTVSSREKDLLKALRDQDLARNLPGKVKVSAPNINKLKK